MKQMVGYWQRCNGASYTASGMSRDTPDLLPCRGQTMLVDSTQFLQEQWPEKHPSVTVQVFCGSAVLVRHTEDWYMLTVYS